MSAPNFVQAQLLLNPFRKTYGITVVGVGKNKSSNGERSIAVIHNKEIAEDVREKMRTVTTPFAIEFSHTPTDA